MKLVSIDMQKRSGSASATGERRKMLRRSLGDAFGEPLAAAALAGSGIAATRRPEELTVAELARLADAVAVARARLGLESEGPR